LATWTALDWVVVVAVVKLAVEAGGAKAVVAVGCENPTKGAVVLVVAVGALNENEVGAGAVVAMVPKLKPEQNNKFFLEGMNLLIFAVETYSFWPLLLILRRKEKKMRSETGKTHNTKKAESDLTFRYNCDGCKKRK
jgi:hypothetical protein